MTSIRKKEVFANNPLTAMFPFSGLEKTRPFRSLLLDSIVLDWLMVSSCQNVAVNGRNRAETTNQK